MPGMFRYKSMAYQATDEILFYRAQKTLRHEHKLKGWARCHVLISDYGSLLFFPKVGCELKINSFIERERKKYFANKVPLFRGE